MVLCSGREVVKSEMLNKHWNCFEDGLAQKKDWTYNSYWSPDQRASCSQTGCCLVWPTDELKRWRVRPLGREWSLRCPPLPRETETQTTVITAPYYTSKRLPLSPLYFPNMVKNKEFLILDFIYSTVQKSGARFSFWRTFKVFSVQSWSQTISINLTLNHSIITKTQGLTFSDYFLFVSTNWIYKMPKIAQLFCLIGVQCVLHKSVRPTNCLQMKNSIWKSCP